MLHVGTPGDYRPYAYRTADGGFAGAEIDLVRAFAAGQGLRVAIEATSWKTMQEDFIQGRFDMVIGGVSVTPERARDGDFSIALAEDGKRPLTRCADQDRYATIAAIDRPGVRVVTNPGGTNESFARLHFHAASLAVAPDNASVPAWLAAGREDVFVTDGAEVDVLVKRFAGTLCAASVAQPFTHLTKAWWLPQDAAFKQAVDAFLTRAKADGSWQAALDRAAAAP